MRDRSYLSKLQVPERILVSGGDLDKRFTVLGNFIQWRDKQRLSPVHTGDRIFRHQDVFVQCPRASSVGIDEEHSYSPRKSSWPNTTCSIGY